MAKKTAPAAAPAPVEPVAMSVNVAIGNVNNVIRAYKGDANEHEILKQSIDTIASTLNENLADMEAAEARIAELEASESALQAELEALKAEHAEPEPEPEPEPAKVELTPAPIAKHASRFTRAAASPNATPKQ